MRARVPQDVDLEDELVYGLTALRFAYLVVGGLAALALLHGGMLPRGGARAVAALVVAALGAVMAWGRWQGRPADAWLLDLAVFLGRNLRLVPLWRPHFRSARPRAAAPVVSLKAINALRARSRLVPLPAGPEPGRDRGPSGGSE